MIDLSGHKALITGSTKGVGRSIAEAFARAGAGVVIHGRKMSDDAQAAIDTCRASGGAASFITSDLSGPTGESVRATFDAAVETEPGIDILVNNAGQYFDQPYLDMTLERLERTMRLNVMAPYMLTQAFARRWRERGIGGRVLMIGSINGRLAEPESTAYDTSKGAVEMMVRTLCVALAPHGIRVNGLAPGLVRTPQTAWIDERTSAAEWIAHHTPNGRIPHSDVCGDGAVYLCSDAAEHVHGQMLLIDGGMSAWQQPEEGGR
ncbi:MAG: oxidoreductase [Phycisphaeraceae bacterium]|nr:oxidoreductase [Phycisphaeraceae bacterium]